MGSKNIILRTGTYHTKALDAHGVRLFDILSEIYRSSSLGTIESNKDFYRLLYLKRAGDFLAANLVRVRKKDYANVVPEGTNEIKKQEMNDTFKGRVRFYLDSENNIFLEDLHPMIGYSKFAEILSSMIRTHLATQDIYFSDSAIVISFDRLKHRKVEEFLKEVDVLERIELKVNTLDNPYRKKEQEIIAKQISDLDPYTMNIKNVQGMNKKSDIIGAIEGLAEDGHVDVRMYGTNRDSEKIDCESNSKVDDSYVIHIEDDNDINSFIEGITKIVSKIRKKRKSS
ncbi:MAG: hypothetical protein LBJ20_03695 [Candidatus Methanoplasma sp.]|nr:hypothetical protein [Candidatus Methanoplasma sp.]